MTRESRAEKVGQSGNSKEGWNEGSAEMIPQKVGIMNMDSLIHESSL